MIANLSSIRTTCYKMCHGCEDVELPLMTDPELSSPKFGWTHSEYYAASRLCDFMGIVAAPIIHDCDSNLEYMIACDEEDGDRIYAKVVFHQIAVRCHNIAGIKEIEHLARQVFGLVDAKDKTQDDNNATLAIQLLYHHYGQLDHFDSPGVLMEYCQFMVDHLGWSSFENKRYGYTIEFNKENE